MQASTNIDVTAITRYGLVNRPAGIGCLPHGLRYQVHPRPGAGEPHHHLARHGIVEFERALTMDEARGFELAPLVSGDAVLALADRIAAGSMSRYAAAYVQAASEDPHHFAGTVLDRLGDLDKGVRYSVDNDDGLVAAVLERLKVAAEGSN